MRPCYRCRTGALILLAPVLLAIGLSAGASERTAPESVTLAGRMVCLACELKLRYDAPSDCTTGGHVYGLRTDDGSLYTLLETDRSRPLMRGEKFAYEIVKIEGRRYPRSMFLEVRQVGPAPPGSSAQEGKRTYYCHICAITSYEPGPCVCCGEPVVEVRSEK